MAYLIILTLALLTGATLSVPNRIVGGWKTTIEEWPFIVQMDAIRSTGVWSQTCAANVISEQYVMSAAHCFQGPASNRRIRAGSAYRNTGGTIYEIQWYLNHPSYGQLGFDGDINVVKLIKRIVFSPVTISIKIPSQYSQVPDGAAVKHAGWGSTRSGGTSSPELLETQIYTVNTAHCSQLYAELPGNSIVTSNMICAKYPQGGRDACQGDSGGPLIYGDIIVGVVSWGHGCGNETYPGISTAVSSYTEWIIANTV